MVVPLRRNQSDSSESKIGSRCSWPPGGTVTWPSAASPWPAAPFAVPPALGPSLPWRFWLPMGNCGSCGLGGPGGTAPPTAGSLLGPPAAGVRGSVSSHGSLEPPVVLPLPMRMGSAWVGGPSWRSGMARPLPRSQPLPAGSQLLPAGVPSAAGPAGWPGAPAPGSPGPAGPAGEPGAPAFAAGLKDGAAGAEGPEGADGENLGILAAAVAWEAADGGLVVAVGADSD